MKTPIFGERSPRTPSNIKVFVMIAADAWLQAHDVLGVNTSRDTRDIVRETVREAVQ